MADMKKKRKTTPAPCKKRRRKMIRRPDWCVHHCRRCQHEVDPVKQSCCETRVAGECLSQIHAADIVDVVDLSDGDIHAFNHVWTETDPPASIAVASNTQRRLIAYGKLFRVIHGTGMHRVQVTLPSCCRAPIDAAFPGP